MHLDEYNNQSFGETWGGYVVSAATVGHMPDAGRMGGGGTFPWRDVLHQAGIDHNRSHGPFWETALYFARRAASVSDPRSVLLLRHRANFLLFFAASLLFYLTCARAFGDWKPALLGWLMLVLHPRILADSFYNTVDLAFLSFFIAGAFTLFRLLSRKDVPSALWHALACAWLTDTRAAGLLLPALTLGLLARARLWRPAGVFALAFAPAMILFWPFLWRNTLLNFVDSLGAVLSVRGPATEFAAGRLYNARWIALTTPPAFLFLFLCGAAALAIGAFRKPKAPREAELAFVLTALPLALAASVGAPLYNGWRHHYFVYPFMVIVGVLGFERLRERIGRIRGRETRRRVELAAAALLLAGLLEPVRFIVANHPFQFAYANAFARLGGPDVLPAVMRDYWAVSQRRALELLLTNDSRRPLRVFASDFQRGSAGILPKEERDAFIWVAPGEPADYWISTNPGNSGEVYAENRLYRAVAVDGVPIAAVYR